MPPKPWLTKTGPREDVSAVIQANPTVKEQIPKLSMDQNTNMAQRTGENGTSVNGTNSNGVNGTAGVGSSYGGGIGSSYGSTGGYGSSYGGYGSSYGGYGSSYGGGYGSSYGGYGGYGSSYGMGGYGRMGMMGGMGGMGNDPNQRGFLMNTMMTLQSFGFLIGSFCQIGRSLDQNIEGLSLFYESFKNLFKKMYNGIKNGFSWIGQKTKNSLIGILQFIKVNILFMNAKDSQSKMRALKLIINLSVVVLVMSLYPLLKKSIGKAV